MFRLCSRVLALVIVAFILPATIVLACEGECIVGITNALLGNYTTPMKMVFSEIDSAIYSQVIGPTTSKSTQPTSFLSPLLDEYNKRGYDYMENAIFKSYFHGKCEDPTTGRDPAGCPNPDCPVVCGTPGSIVHFYSKFVTLAFDAIVHLFDEIIKPSSTAYQKFEKGVISATSSNPPAENRQRMVRFMREADWLAEPPVGFDKSKSFEKRTEHIRDRLQSILGQFQSKLKAICGGNRTTDSTELPSCSWEAEFKQYILLFP
ncbi:hypothetical protein BYT27DRAFT_7148368, partial [Phlegmacium glaucopus]